MVVFRIRDYNARKLNMLQCTKPPQPPQAIDVAVQRGSLRKCTKREISYFIVLSQLSAEVAEVAEVPTRNVTRSLKEDFRVALQQTKEINMLQACGSAEVYPSLIERENPIGFFSQRGLVVARPAPAPSRSGERG